MTNPTITLILTLLAQASTPKPLPSPKPAMTADNHSEPAPILMQDNGHTVLIVKDVDTPVGPCDFGKLVRATRRLVNLDRISTPAFRETLLAALESELARCEPKPEPGR